MKELRSDHAGPLPCRDDAAGDGRGIDGIEQQLDPASQRVAGVGGRERLEQRELARREAGGGALDRRRRHRAALPHFVEQVGGDRVGAVQRQRRAQRLDRRVELAVLHAAASQAGPRALVARCGGHDCLVDADRVVAEIAGFHELQRAGLEGFQGGGVHAIKNYTKSRIKNSVCAARRAPAT